MTVWLVGEVSELPLTGVLEGDLAFVIDDGLIYQRDLNTGGWTLKFDPADFAGTIDAADVEGLQAAVEAFLADELAGKANLSHTHPQSDIEDLAADLAGKAALIHTHDGLAPTGGTTGQVLKKTSNTDYDYDWEDDGGSGGGAPEDATYIVQTADGTLTNEQALSSLSTGILKNTTGTGVLSIAAAGDFPTLNQNTTGTASNVTGVVDEANGGTGISTYTQGDILWASAANTLSKLAIGAYGQSPWSDGTDLSYKSTSFMGGFTTGFTTSSTSYVDVTGLTVPLPDNALYAFEVYGTFATTDNLNTATNGIGLSIDGTGGTGQAAVYTIWIQTAARNTAGNNTTSTTPFAIRNENTFNSMTALTSVAQTGSLVFMMKGFYYSGTSGTSTFAVRVRSENGAPQTASVQVGSYCLFTKQA